MAESTPQHSLFGTRGEVAELLTCPLCYERYDEADRAPKYLPCLHGFCVGCLARLVREGLELKCPLCRQDFAVPPGGAQDLPKNFLVGRLRTLECLLDADKTRHQVRCGSCVSDGGPAVGFCQHHTCRTFLCRKCHLAHRQMRKFESHTVLTMEQLREQPELPLTPDMPQCERHRTEVVSVFCNEDGCQRAICLVCATTGHSGHKVIDLDQKCSEIKEELRGLALAAETKHAEVQLLSADMNAEKQRTDAQCEETARAVVAAFDNLQGRLEARRDGVLAELKMLSEDRAGQLNRPTNIAESLALQLATAVQFVETACGIGDPVDLLRTRAQIISRLHELAALDVDEAVPFHPADESFLSLTENHRRVLCEVETLIPSLGQLHASVTAPAFTPSYQIDLPEGLESSWAVKAPHRVRIRAGDPSRGSLDHFEGKVHAYLLAPDGSSLECRDFRQRGDFCELELQPLVCGSHELHVSVSGVPIGGSPLSVEVTDRRPPPVDQDSARAGLDERSLSCDVTWTDAFARVEHTVIVRFSGREDLLPPLDSLSARYTAVDGERPPSSEATSPDARAAIHKTSSPGTFRVVYTPPASGGLYLAITAHGAPIPRSPYLIVVSPLHPDSTDIDSPATGKWSLATAVLDVPYSFTLVTNDYRKRRLTVGGYDVAATLTATGYCRDTTQMAKVTDNQDGSYTVTFTPRVLATHVASFRICGHLLMPGMSLAVTVQDHLPFLDPPGGYKAPSGLAVDRNSNTVYVADGKNGCIHRMKTDGSSMAEGAISISLRKTLQIAVNSEGKLLVLVPGFKCVITINTDGKEELRWSCAADNVKPGNLTLSSSGHVIIGDTQTQMLFVHDAHTGVPVTRQQLPGGSLVPGMGNFCADHRTGEVLVATHYEPFRLLALNPAVSGEIRFLDSPARSNQLALVATPDGTLVIAVLGGIIIVGPDGSGASARRINTDRIYISLAAAEEGFFVALDPGDKRVAKYSFMSRQPNTWV